MATSQIPKAKTPKSRKTSTPVKKPTTKKSTPIKKITNTRPIRMTKRATSFPTPPTRFHYKKKPILTKNMTIFLIIILLLL